MVIKNEREYFDAVRAALLEAGLPPAHSAEAPDYDDYVVCAEVVGDGDIVADRSADGRVRILVRAVRADAHPG